MDLMPILLGSLPLAHNAHHSLVGIYLYICIIMHVRTVHRDAKEELDRLHNINKVSGAKCFDSYDFATLYTNNPHDGLKRNIRNLVREAYKVRGAEVSHCRQTWESTLVPITIISDHLHEHR